MENASHATDTEVQELMQKISELEKEVEKQDVMVEELKEQNQILNVYDKNNLHDKNNHYNDKKSLVRYGLF